jgi:predicted nucleic acid-binding protein
LTRLVVDASVAVKWFLPEPHSEEALGLLDGKRELLVPDLLWAEVGNVLWKRWRQGELSEDAADGILQDLRKLPLAVHPSDEIAGVAWSFATRLGRSFYDSLYLALAANQSCSMVTADRRLWNAVGSAVPFLIWIEHLSSKPQ